MNFKYSRTERTKIIDSASLEKEAMLEILENFETLPKDRQDVYTFDSSDFATKVHGYILARKRRSKELQGMGIQKLEVVLIIRREI